MKILLLIFNLYLITSCNSLDSKKITHEDVTKMFENIENAYTNKDLKTFSMYYSDDLKVKSYYVLEPINKNQFLSLVKNNSKGNIPYKSKRITRINLEKHGKSGTVYITDGEIDYRYLIKSTKDRILISEIADLD